MKSRILDERVTVLQSMSLGSPVLDELRAGQEVVLGKVTTKDGSDWVQVTLDSGVKGFLPGQTSVHVIQVAALRQAAVDVREGPTPRSAVVGKRAKGA
ncbi:MAG: SH3 domain-containing protein [Planctomycetes bacterium]|nr:SH3 domain-containing protein [Planctomycetota bacterium]